MKKYLGKGSRFKYCFPPLKLGSYSHCPIHTAGNIGENMSATRPTIIPIKVDVLGNCRKSSSFKKHCRLSNAILLWTALYSTKKEKRQKRENAETFNTSVFPLQQWHTVENGEEKKKNKNKNRKSNPSKCNWFLV